MSKYFLKVIELAETFRNPNFGEPKNYMEASFENFDAYTAGLKNIVKTLMEYDGGSITLISETPGTGKTHLAIATAREYFRKKIFNWINENAERDFGYRMHAEQEFWENFELHKPIFMTEESCYRVDFGNLAFNFWLHNPRVVIVDDLFASKVNENSRAAIYEIVNTRVANYGLPTIFTTNVLPQDMVDSRIASRLQSGEVYILHNIKDYRRK